jgi:hypothetical protein
MSDGGVNRDSLRRVEIVLRLKLTLLVRTMRI